jgi:hypothetical protein
MVGFGLFDPLEVADMLPQATEVSLALPNRDSSAASCTLASLIMSRV